MKLKPVVTGTIGALVIAVSAVGLGACGRPADPLTPDQGLAQEAGPDADTIALVSSDVTSTLPAGGGTDRTGLHMRLLRALHGTWVTQGQDGTVTHQAIRGEVTAVTPTSITVKAKDGVSIAFAVTADTDVHKRANGHGADSTIGEVKVGFKALVAGVGATDPTAKHIIFLS